MRIAEKITSEIISFVVSNEEHYIFLALRGDDKNITIGEILDNSADMTDDHEGEYLDGTSCHSIPRAWDEDSVRDAIEDFSRNYSYYNLSIVTGSSKKLGDDQGEVIVQDCQVLATWKVL